MILLVHKLLMTGMNIPRIMPILDKEAEVMRIKVPITQDDAS